MNSSLRFFQVLLPLLILLFQVTYAQIVPTKKIIPGAERIPLVQPAIKNKVIAVVANQTSMVGNQHLVDTLLKIGAKIKVIFSPEHGFRGTSEAGENIKNGKDLKTGIPIVSLYGKKVKPSAEDLKGIDVVFFDIQDVGVRYYTYISTLTYVMQACAEHFIPIFILDRPNPNGFYVDGPVLDKKYKSFVGMHPIPLVYGMTIAELATMINEEGWLGTIEKCAIGVIPIQNYSHKFIYNLPVNPSPNLKCMEAIYLYPSLGLFEGTAINVGRGTDFPFQVYGHPQLKDSFFTYIPRSIANVSSNPPHMGKVCKGVDLRNIATDSLIKYRGINVHYVIDAYKQFPNKGLFFNKFFENLAGNATLRTQIIKGASAEDIKKSWEADIQKFKELRKKYLIYEDFE